MTSELHKLRTEIQRREEELQQMKLKLAEMMKLAAIFPLHLALFTLNVKPIESVTFEEIPHDGDVLPLGRWIKTTVYPTDEPVKFAVHEAERTLQNVTEVPQAKWTLVRIEAAWRRNIAEGEDFLLCLRLSSEFLHRQDLCNVTVFYQFWQKDPKPRLRLIQSPACKISQDLKPDDDVTSEDLDVKFLDGLEKAEVEIPGGEMTVTGKPPKDVLEALDSAMKQLNGRMKRVPYLVVHGNLSKAVITRQVVNGIIYRFYHLPVLQTTCLKDHTVDQCSLQCPLQKDGLELVCYLEVFFQPSRREYFLENCNCAIAADPYSSFAPDGELDLCT